MTFFKEDTAVEWKKETNCKYPVVCDEKRLLYKHFGFLSSIQQTWCIRTQIWYAEQICQGRAVIPVREGDDPHQLGGNIIVGGEGKIEMIYYCSSPADRPSLDDMLNVIEDMKSHTPRTSH